MRDLLTDRETARILGKRIDSLYKIVDAFDAQSDDEWELVEGEHFEFTGAPVAAAQGKRARRFTEEGIEALARYIETKEKIGLLRLLRDRIFNVKQKRRQMLVSRRITQEFMEMGDDLVIRGELAFVSRKTTVSILQTNYQGLSNSWSRLRSTGTEDGEEALEIDKDFVEAEAKIVLISQRGIARVARDMHKNSQITPARKAWIEAVGDVVETCFNAEIRHLTQGSDLAIKRAKGAAGNRCEVTGQKSSRQTKVDLAGHHLFDRCSRPDLADLSDNILVIIPDLHQEFHSWRPGACTPNDFLTFAETVRADLFDPVNSRQMKRLQTLTRRLKRLQHEREGQQVRYHRS
ncbi:hypothetical protein KQ304_08850 [Synechococcus sp. CS-1329]|uniref:hypothetical protein n=1 Tax=Synechococcus sp. CS-1329 TaxID=2847975 RepID=UPI00223AC2DC|nr:hypothetical protein [Synechococcus sp. CS-1329]MCT0219104.1 hypothetical protein [Synechococcus sp. CS-1329]